MYFAILSFTYISSVVTTRSTLAGLLARLTAVCGVYLQQFRQDLLHAAQPAEPDHPAGQAVRVRLRLELRRQLPAPGRDGRRRRSVLTSCLVAVAGQPCSGATRLFSSLVVP